MTDRSKRSSPARGRRRCVDRPFLFFSFPWYGSSPPETLVRIGERKSGDMQTSCRETVEHNSDTRTRANDSHMAVPLRTL